MFPAKITYNFIVAADQSFSRDAFQDTQDPRMGLPWSMSISSNTKALYIVTVPIKKL